MTSWLTNFSFVMKLIVSNCSENTIGLILGEVMRLTRDFWKSVTLDNNEGHHSSGFKDPVVLSVPQNMVRAREHLEGLTLPHTIQCFPFAALMSLLLTVLLLVYQIHSIPQSAYKSDLFIHLIVHLWRISQKSSNTDRNVCHGGQISLSLLQLASFFLLPALFELYCLSA